MGTFSLFGALLERVENGEVQKELCMGLMNAVVSASSSDNGDDNDAAAAKEKRSAMLAALFNLRSDGIEKVRILTHIVNLAEESMLVPGVGEGVSSLSDMLMPETLEQSLVVWGGAKKTIPEEEKRGLFRAVVNGMDRLLGTLKSSGGKGAEDATAEALSEGALDKNIRDVDDRKQTYLLMILDTYKDEVRDYLFHCVHLSHDICMNGMINIATGVAFKRACSNCIAN